MKSFSIVVRLFIINFLLSCYVLHVSGQRPLDTYDSLLRISLSDLHLPAQFRTLQLPPVVDNSLQPYWRPIFNQSGASCGQAAGVAYNFTYEMCRRLNRDASLPEHQFPSHFVYNFMNYNGYYGVNYYHSFEVLRTLGTPTLAHYGGMAIDNGNKWISGYDFYRNAMRNRIKAVHRIKTNDVEGLITLKHWLAHHLEGAAVGGVANFNAASPWGLQPLPQGTPEAGKLVMAQFQGHQATHAMTIVGYNDSIRWDYNGDGQFTNHLDINNDGVVNLLDYEIGAFKVANSYGSSWGNDGYFYMMYRLLGIDVYYGGIWNQQVEVIELNEPYEPLLTMKLTLRHNKREQIRINAGISADTASTVPEHRLMFPVFNFQGGPQFMQGGTTDPQNQYIEIGLDITPLLNVVNSGQAARIFLEILENDSIGDGYGEIISFAVRDYTLIHPIEIPCPHTNVELNDNTITRLSLLHTPVFDDVRIITEQITSPEPGVQLEASGGQTPYKWSLQQPYRQQQKQLPFPLAQQEQLQLESPNYRFARKAIDFEFPFYGEKFNEVFVHRDGYLLFAPELFPWPYYKDTWLLFRTMKNISAFLVSPIQYYPGTKGADGIWYEGDSLHATFRWKKPLMYYDRQIGYGEFAITLYPDGKIEIHYGDIQTFEPVLWYAGVSAGEQAAYSILRGSGGRLVPAYKSFVFLPEPSPDGIVLNPDGWLSGAAELSQQILNLYVTVSDNKGLTDSKLFQLSDLLHFRLSPSVTPIAGQALSFDLVIRNLSNETLNDVLVTLESQNEWLQLTQPQVQTNINAHDSVFLQSAFVGQLSQFTPNGSYFPLKLKFQTVQGIRYGSTGFEAKAAEVMLTNHTIADGDNQRLDPGETAPFIITLSNMGAIAAGQLKLSLQLQDTYVSANQTTSVLPEIPAGAELKVPFLLTAADNCPIGHKLSIKLFLIQSEDTLIRRMVTLKIGQYPVFVFLRSSSDFSSNVIRSTLEELEVPYVFGTSLPDTLQDYRLVMACLGGVTSSGSLGADQAAKLTHFLNRGGRLYLEGASIWAFNRPPQLYEKFSVIGAYLSPAVPATFIDGVEGSFTQGLSFSYSNSAVPYLFFEVAPIGNAFALLKPRNNPFFTVMSGFETPDYKTIASAVEFGYLDDQTSTNSRKELMTKMLNFFDLGNVLTNLHPPAPQAQPQTFSLEPNPAASFIRIHFEDCAAGQAVMAIFNASGQLILTRQLLIPEGRGASIIDFSQLKSGLYFVQIKTAGKVFRQKLIKK